jgi:hypothetical protein
VSAASRAPDALDAPEEGPAGWPFWTGLVVGWAIIAFGLRQVVVDAAATNPTGLAAWVLGGVLVHDLVVAPIATAVALLLARIGSRWWTGPVAASLAVSAIVVAFAFPLLRGYGRRDANPSALPRDYGAATLALVVGIWSVAAVVVLWRARRR